MCIIIDCICIFFYKKKKKMGTAGFLQSSSKMMDFVEDFVYLKLFFKITRLFQRRQSIYCLLSEIFLGNLLKNDQSLVSHQPDSIDKKKFQRKTPFFWLEMIRADLEVLRLFFFFVG